MVLKKEGKKSQSRGRLRGRGISTYIEATAAGGFAPVRPGARHLGEGRHASRCAPRAHNHGQGHETTLAQVVSAVLGVPVEKFRLRTSEPDFS